MRCLLTFWEWKIVKNQATYAIISRIWQGIYRVLILEQKLIFIRGHWYYRIAHDKTNFVALDTYFWYSSPAHNESNGDPSAICGVSLEIEDHLNDNKSGSEGDVLSPRCHLCRTIDKIEIDDRSWLYDLACRSKNGVWVWVEQTICISYQIFRACHYDASAIIETVIKDVKILQY